MTQSSSTWPRRDKGAQPGSPTQAATLSKYSRDIDTLFRNGLGNAQSKNWYDPELAPYATLTAMDTPVQFSVGVSPYNATFELPWQLQTGFVQSVNCDMIVASPTRVDGLNISANSYTLVDALHPRSGQKVPVLSWQRAPQGPWNKSNEIWYLAMISLRLPPPTTVLSGRLVAFTFEAELTELASPLVTSWESTVRIYSMNIKDVAQVNT